MGISRTGVWRVWRLAAIGGVVGAVLFAPGALANTPDVTGSWANPADPSGPPWHLTASSDLERLTGYWTGGNGHQGLRGTLDAGLVSPSYKGGPGQYYSGTLHITEGSLSVGGTIKLAIVSPYELSVTTHQDNGYGQTFTLDRQQHAVKHLQVAIQDKQFHPTNATITWDATVTICNRDPIFQHPFSFSKAGAYTTLIHEVHPGSHVPAYYLPVPKAGGRSLAPAGEAHACGSFRVHNTSGKALGLLFFDEAHSMENMDLIIEPKP